MQVFRSLPASALRNLVFLFGAALCFWASLTTLLPTLPLYIEQAGATQQQVGLVMGSFAIGLLLTRGLFGRWADFHSRKRVILIGTAMVGLAPLGYGLTTSLPLLMFLRAAHGLSIAGLTTGYSTLVIDIAPKEQRGEVLGYMTLVAPLGMALGPALGGWLEAEYGFGVLFGVAGVLGLIAFIGMCLVQETPRSPQGSAENLSFFNLFVGIYTDQLSQGRRLQIPALVLVMIGMVFGALVAFLPAYIRDSEVDLNGGLFWTIVAIASFSVRVVTGKASDRIGRGPFITISIVLYLLSMVLLAIATTPQHFILSALAEGAGSGTLLPMMITLVADRSPVDQRGQAFAVCVGGFDLGIALGGSVLGIFVADVGYRGTFGLAAALALLALTIFTTQCTSAPGRSLRFACGRIRDEYAQ